MPANAVFFTSYMIEVATWDPLPIDAIWFIWSLPAKDPWSDSFDSIGYSFVYPVENFGIGTLMIHFVMLCALIVWILPQLECASPIFKHPKFIQYEHKLFFNGILLLFFEGYTQFSISICISLVNLDWDPTQGFSVFYCNILTVTFAVILVALIIFIPVFYTLNIDRLHEDSFRERCGALYEGLKLGKI